MSTVTRKQNEMLQLPELRIKEVETRPHFATECISDIKRNEKPMCSVNDWDKDCAIPWQNSEQTCVICCEKAADVVLLPCNHGGLCYECANTIADKNPVCHFCRKKFWQIIRMEIAPGNSTDFIKVAEMKNIMQYPKLPPTKNRQIN